MLPMQIWHSGRLQKKTSRCLLQWRAHRQTTNQKVVQKGGVISGRSARAAIDARVEAEAQKAGRAAARRYK